MIAYIIRRLLLMIPTLFGIMLLNFIVLQFLPGGPVEQVIAQLTGTAVEATSRVAGSGGAEISREQQAATQGAAAAVTSKYRGAQGLDPELIKDLEQQFGLDKPAHERFFLLIWNYLQFDFGESFFRDRAVISHRKNARLNFTGCLDHPAYIFNLHPLGHCQGGSGRHPV